MTIYRGTIVDTPDNPFSGGELRSESDGALLVQDGVIVARGPATQVLSEYPEQHVVTLDSGLLLPGFVDTHVHYPQVRVIGGLGMPLLEWLDRRALPEEAQLADRGYASQVAAEFLSGLVGAGTTSALVFGSHFATAVDELFTCAAEMGPRITAGLVLSDRVLRDDLLTTPGRAAEESIELAHRWHGHGRLRYAVTPRFSLSCTDPMLKVCGELMTDLPDVHFTSHINENPAEIAQVTGQFGGSYVDSYARHGLVGERSTLAHNVHPTGEELAILGATRTGIAHCPTSNAALGSGSFPMRAHLEQGVRFALGTDVGGGTGFGMFKEGVQAYFIQQLLGDRGTALTATHLLYLATAAGADLLRLPDVGDLSVGKRFDAVWVRPESDTPLAVGLRHAEGLQDAVARTFALGTPADIAQVWIDGETVRTNGAVHSA